MRTTGLCTALLAVVLGGLPAQSRPAQGSPAQNSTAKIRPAPSALAAKAGSAVRWRKDLDAALAEAAKTGKPVFWYVPTLSRSPMDRKPEIDRYMLAGPFSWPRCIQLLNEHYVPVRQAGRPGDRRTYGIVRGRFIEPGYLVLRPGKAGKPEVLRRRESLSTFHPEWFLRPLYGLVGRKLPPAPAGAGALGEFIAGAELFRQGQTAAAVALWKAAAARHPEDPMAWKCMAEAEGHGPFRRGFEVFGPLPAAAMVDDPDTRGTAAPAGTYQETEIWRRCVDFLLGMQDDTGGWMDSTYDFGGTDSLPNVHCAVSALVCWGLLEARTRVDKARKDRIDKALGRALDYLCAPSSINPRDRDELVWAHTYRFLLVDRWLRGKPEAGRAGRLEGLRRDLVKQLQAMQGRSGAWYHEYENPFVTAEVLLVLQRAQELGLSVDPRRLAAGKAALLRCRSKVGGYSYSMSRRQSRAAVIGSAGRMPLCELALLRLGAADQKRLDAAVGAGLQHHGLLEAIRRYDDHADRYGYGGFFFWFDMLGRSRAILSLSDPKQRARRLAAQRQLLLALPEIDGCFVDSHELGRCYGTGVALICLGMLPKAQ